MFFSTAYLPSLAGLYDWITPQMNSQNDRINSYSKILDKILVFIWIRSCDQLIKLYCTIGEIGMDPPARSRPRCAPRRSQGTRPDNYCAVGCINHHTHTNNPPAGGKSEGGSPPHPPLDSCILLLTFADSKSLCWTSPQPPTQSAESLFTRLRLDIPNFRRLFYR